jgi:regulatory GntR family protein
MWRWLYTELRSAIIDGRLKSGARLPSTRNLAAQYGLARGTVVAAFQQLQCSVANYTRRFEGLASRSIVGNRVMETVPVTGIPPWDRGMGQGEMRIFRFDLGQPVRVSKHKPRKSRNAVGQVGKPWGSFSPPILAIVPAVPARPCMRGGTGTGTCRATQGGARLLGPCSSRPEGRICLYGR